MKRKNEEPQVPPGQAKKRALSDEEAKNNLRDGLFSPVVLDGFRKQYAESHPYKHGVISNLVNNTLLRRVRAEILEHLHFTPKETDIYKIHQSGDLANLDGLDDESLARLPSLLTLRDALYSSAFRKYISQIADAGPLSGKKTDMAINVYTPGCHLLCHDDVIGTRRLSYILYLTDPGHPWKPEWGGALRLYPTQTMKASDGTEATVPSSDFTVVIPPAFNQLSFFTIQPGKSFHDVEEVYKRREGEDSNDGGRVRMAISGWFHIPQAGEEGYEDGLEEKLTERSSLSQLQAKADEFDLPQPNWKDVAVSEASTDGLDFTDEQFDWLLRFINPTYLTPDTVEQLRESFDENSVISLVDFLHPKFAEKLRSFISAWDESSPPTIPTLKGSSEMGGTASPPHKHRFLYRRATLPQPSERASDTPLDLLLEQLLPSPLFARWLSLITGLTLSKSHGLARRFRRGLDYTLATSYEDDDPQLEVTLGITTTSGWGDDDDDDSDEDEDGDEEIPASGQVDAQNGKGKAGATEPDSSSNQRGKKDEDNVGGYDVYMAGDDDDEDEDEDEEEEQHGAADAAAAAAQCSSNTGAGQRRKAKADPAIYRSSAGGAGDEDDGVLFSTPANWNRLSVVLRDKGLLRFVKYVSASAPGDRWDVVSCYSVVPGDDDDDDDDDDE